MFDVDLTNENWKQVYKSSDESRRRYEFLGKPGLKLDPNLSPTEFFNYFVDDDMI